MRAVFVRGVAIAAVMAAVGITGGAQQAPPSPNDPRVGLKPGLKDAGVAAWNMELVSSMPKPEGFFDPKDPLGPVTPPEQPPSASGNAAPAQPAPPPTPAPGAPP